MPTATPKKIRVDLHKAQYDFRHSPALYRGFCGGRGAGKSFIGSYDLIRRAKPKRLYAIYAPTYPLLRDASLRSFFDVAQRFNFVERYNKSENLIWLGNGAQIICRSLDDPENARGPNLSGAWIDEAGLVTKTAYDIVIGCLREGGEQGWLSATFTPKGKRHWTYEVLGSGKENTKLTTARTRDNPFLPPGFYEALRGQYTSTFAEQELEGKFIDIEGDLAKREWFGEPVELPKGLKLCRAWDFAATEKSAKSKDPDYTAGALLGRNGVTFYIAGMVHGRYSAGKVESVALQTAGMDGKKVAVLIEEEPGASGKIFARSLITKLAGYNVHKTPARGDKITRAMPFLAQAEAGNVKLIRGPWNADFLDEIVTFGTGGHDDQVDAVAHAFNYLTKPKPGLVFA